MTSPAQLNIVGTLTTNDFLGPNSSFFSLFFRHLFALSTFFCTFGYIFLHSLVTNRVNLFAISARPYSLHIFIVGCWGEKKGLLMTSFAQLQLTWSLVNHFEQTIRLKFVLQGD